MLWIEQAPVWLGMSMNWCLGSVPVSAAVALCCSPDFPKRQGTGNTPLSHFWVHSRVVEPAGVFSLCHAHAACWGWARLFQVAVVPGSLSHGSLC